MTPHTCPVCVGRGTVPPVGDQTSTVPVMCPACLGACVLWEPGEPPAPFVRHVWPSKVDPSLGQGGIVGTVHGLAGWRA